ncbi:unnamed protein product [Caenorhabditis sp. 36 PRJEB53466]|nr:unnamed protein product [Caenorhabditis sp. 36 PRJEB53466]
MNGSKIVVDIDRSEIAHGNFVTKRHAKRPSGANMKKMMWNGTLAVSADSYARANPSTHSHRAGIGENLYWHWATRPGNLNRFGQMAAESWINEFKSMDWDTTILTNQLFGSGVGHATQMVWADTDQVGCAYATFNEVHKKTGRPITKICVVCHYWPKGNFLNEKIYLEGVPCSKCDSKKCDKSAGLCL